MIKDVKMSEYPAPSGVTVKLPKPVDIFRYTLSIMEAELLRRLNNASYRNYQPHKKIRKT